MSLMNPRSTPSSPTKRLALAEKSVNVPSLPNSPTKAKDALSSTGLERATAGENSGESTTFPSKKRAFDDAPSRHAEQDDDTRPVKHARILDAASLPLVPALHVASSGQSEAASLPTIRTDEHVSVYLDRDEDDGSPTEVDETPESSLEARMDVGGIGSGSGSGTSGTLLTEDVASVEDTPSDGKNVSASNAASLPSTQSSTLNSLEGGDAAAPSTAQLLRLRLRLARFKVSTNQASTPLSNLEVRTADLAKDTKSQKQYLELKIQEGPFVPKQRRSRKRQSLGYRYHDPRRQQCGTAYAASHVQPGEAVQHVPTTRPIADLPTNDLDPRNAGNVNATPRSPQGQPRTLLDIYGKDFERHLWPENSRGGRVRSSHLMASEHREVDSREHADMRIEGWKTRDNNMDEQGAVNAASVVRMEKPIMVREDSNISMPASTPHVQHGEADIDNNVARMDKDIDEPESDVEVDSDSDSASEEDEDRTEDAKPLLNCSGDYIQKPRPYTGTATTSNRAGDRAAKAAAASQSFNAVLNTPHRHTRVHDSLDSIDALDARDASHRRWRSESPPSSSSHRRRFWDYGGARARISDVRGQQNVEREKERELTSSAVRGRAAGTLLMLGR